DNWQAPRLHSGSRDLPLEDRVAHDADTVRIRDRDGSLEYSRFPKPRGSGHLAVAVERVPRAEYGIVAALPSRMDDGHAGANRPLSNDELASARDQCGVPDFDAGNVGDGIEWPCYATDHRREAELARAGPLCG